MERLQSYLSGQWVSGNGSQTPLFNPVDGTVVAETSTEGLDLAAAFQHARTVGLPTLQALTFAERGAILAAMSKAVHGARERLIDMGRVNAGNTRKDAKFDIDGASGTLMHYAKLGASLGDTKVLLDGDAIQIGGARMQGQHILTGRPGVAVHINAFNFPAWGLAEKAACAILAGMPVISKPATSTALMTYGMVKAITDAGVVPDGVLSLVCGSARDLLDHVEWSDVIAFTGGEETAERIRNHPRVLKVNPAVNLEADSLNAMVLLPGLKEVTYDAFIRDVHLEMTQKAGQKCTAVRRIFVPESMLDEVMEDLDERLSRTVVGDPSQAGVHMGPLATEAQAKSARDGIARLLEECSIVHGDPNGAPLEGIEEGTGCFITPLLLRVNDAEACTAVHELEVFGPVATLIPYDDSVESACAGVRQGAGCLVSAIYGDDKALLSDAIIGLSGWNGRLVITDAKVAEQSYAPGMVLPHLMHGGPGRAGGGEELGGVRGMALYQQRTALQGNGPLIARLVG